MEKFFGAVQNMFKIPELRTRILFTLGLLAVYRFGAHVQAPGINSAQLEKVWGEVAGTLLGVELDIEKHAAFAWLNQNELAARVDSPQMLRACDRAFAALARPRKSK